MARRQAALPWIIAGVLVIVATVSIVTAVVQCKAAGFAGKEQTAKTVAEREKEEAYREIEKTPASDLVAGSPRPESLYGARDQLVDEFTADAADRVREILSRYRSEGTP